MIISLCPSIRIGVPLAALGNRYISQHPRETANKRDNRFWVRPQSICLARKQIQLPSGCGNSAVR